MDRRLLASFLLAAAIGFSLIAIPAAKAAGIDQPLGLFAGIQQRLTPAAAIITAQFQSLAASAQKQITALKTWLGQPENKKNSIRVLAVAPNPSRANSAPTQAPDILPAEIASSNNTSNITPPNIILPNQNTGTYNSLPANPNQIALPSVSTGTRQNAVGNNIATGKNKLIGPPDVIPQPTTTVQLGKQCTQDSDCPKLGAVCSTTYCPQNLCKNGSCAKTNIKCTTNECANINIYGYPPISSCSMCGAWGKCVSFGGDKAAKWRTCNYANSSNANELTQCPIMQFCGASKSVCNINWQCSDWSECKASGGAMGGTQTRVCTDTNNCGSKIGEPAQIQSCWLPTTPRITTFTINGRTSNGWLSVPKNLALNISWNTANMVSCTAGSCQSADSYPGFVNCGKGNFDKQWGGPKDISGAQQSSKIIPPNPVVYTLTCVGTNGTTKWQSFGVIPNR